MSEQFKTLKFDPRDLIGGPFEDCPNCRQHDFGVLHIRDNTYTRRCRSCWHKVTFWLPELKKKIIYLDQFVFSNIVKMLSADVPGHERAKKEPLWRELFESLDVLSGMQLIVCPDSTEHHDESLLWPFYQELKHAYEHFSTGISFDRPSSIDQGQIVEAFKAWLKGQKPEFQFDASEVVHPRKLHDWQDRIFITVDGLFPGYEQAVRQLRSNSHGNLGRLFKQWKDEKKTFAQVFEMEKDGYADVLLRGIERDRQEAEKLGSMFTRLGRSVPRSVSRYSATLNNHLMIGLEWVAEMHLLEKRGHERDLEEAEHEKLKDEAREKVIAFIKSGAMNETPSNIIAASMYAALASKAAAGQKRLPDEGMATDIKVVSALLPYCDAMFVDNFCRSLLTDIPQTHKLPYQCRIFSSKTSDEFLQYLRDIRNSATAEHVTFLQQVYGPEVL